MRHLWAQADEQPRFRDGTSQRAALTDQIERFFQDWDAWIAPAFPRPAFTHRPLNAAIEIDDQRISQDLAAVMSNVIFNFSGHPSVVVLIGFSRDGLPIGAQIVGRLWGEMALLDVAEQVAQIAGAYRRPPEF